MSASANQEQQPFSLPQPPWLDDKGPVVLPDYDGGSILNIHYSILNGFGVRGAEGVPLRDARFAGLLGEARKVVVLLLDAMGFEAMRLFGAAKSLPVWDAMVAAGTLTSLTSVFPSATNVVLNSFHTGLTPLQHGMPGYRLYIPAVDRVCEMIGFYILPIADREKRRSLFDDDSRVTLDEFSNPTLCERIAAHGVPAYVVFRKSIINSHLSRLNHRGATGWIPYVDTADQMIQVRRVLEKVGPQAPAFVYTYWDAMDMIQHMYGASGEELEAECAKVFYSLEREFFQKLAPELGAETLLLVFSDHGQITVAPEKSVPLHAQDAALLKRIHLPPAGNPRVCYLRAADPDDAPALREEIRDCLPASFVVVSTTEVADSGLFGPGVPHPDLVRRMGDVAVFAPPEACLYYTRREGEDPRLGGKHGGLSPEEMRIPLLGLRVEDYRR